LRRRDRDPAPTGFGQRVASLVSPGLPGTHEEGDEDADAIFPCGSTTVWCCHVVRLNSNDVADKLLDYRVCC